MTILEFLIIPLFLFVWKYDVLLMGTYFYIVSSLRQQQRWQDFLIWSVVYVAFHAIITYGLITLFPSLEGRL